MVFRAFSFFHPMAIVPHDGKLMNCGIGCMAAMCQAAAIIEVGPAGTSRVIAHIAPAGATVLPGSGTFRRIGNAGAPPAFDNTKNLCIFMHRPMRAASAVRRKERLGATERLETEPIIS
jgi:hypothetical protein